MTNSALDETQTIPHVKQLLASGLVRSAEILCDLMMSGPRDHSASWELCATAAAVAVKQREYQRAIGLYRQSQTMMQQALVVARKLPSASAAATARTTLQNAYADTQLAIVKCYVKLRQDDAALRELQDIPPNNRSLAAVALAASLYRRHKETQDKAIANYQEIISRNPFALEAVVALLELGVNPSTVYEQLSGATNALALASATNGAAAATAAGTSAAGVAATPTVPNTPAAASVAHANPITPVVSAPSSPRKNTRLQRASQQPAAAPATSMAANSGAMLSTPVSSVGAPGMFLDAMTPSTEAPLQSASQNQLRGISSMLVTPAGAPAIATTPSTSGAAGPAVAAASVAAAPAAPRVTKQKLDAPRVARVSRVAGVSAASVRALRFEAGTRENDSPRHNRTAASAVAQTPSVAQTPVARSGNAATTTARNGAEGQAQGARWIHSFMAAHACRAKQSHAKALHLFLALERTFPRSKYVLEHIALCHLFLDQIEAAKTVFEKLRTIEPLYARSMDVYMFYCLPASEAARINALMQDMLVASKECPETWTAVAIYQSHVGDVNGALASIDKALSFNASHKLAYILRGNLLLERSDFEESIRSYRNAILCDQRHPLALKAFRGIIRVLLDQVDELEHQNDPNESPEYKQARLQAMQRYREESQWVAQQSVTSFPTDPTAHALYGLVLEHAAKEFNRARQYYEFAIRITREQKRPCCIDAVAGLAGLLMHEKKFDQAQKLLEQELAMTKHELLHLQMAELMETCGNLGGALFHFQAALALNPHSAAATQGIMAINRTMFKQPDYEEDEASDFPLLDSGDEGDADEEAEAAALGTR